ncbi:MAG: hypothetical protein ACHBN1_14940 [Heteroscytonema crispum UTEX LB 1556]
MHSQVPPGNEGNEGNEGNLGTRDNQPFGFTSTKEGNQKRSTRFTTNNQQRDRASPVAWVGKTPLRPYQGRPFTNNHQPRRGSPVAWVGKTPLRPLARPQDRSGSPTKGAKLTGGNLPDCRLRAPSPPTNNAIALHQSPGSGNQKRSTRFTNNPTGEPVTCASVTKSAVRASPTTNPT